MHSLILKVAGTTFAAAAGVCAHGHVAGINVAGVWYEGYDPTTFPFKSHPPTVVGWTAGKTNEGFVGPAAYDSEDIICHVNAKPAGGYASVKAGDKIETYWTAWPDSHKGPITNMLANCNGDCRTVSKTDLEFFKIAAVGLVNDDTPPGEWATDTLIANNNSWVIKIPEDLAEGNYVWRQEIIALHSAENVDGAQNYPQCFNLAVTGTGTLAPSGVRGEALYHESDAGILVDIYTTLTSYDIPGPTQIPAGTNLVQSHLTIKSDASAITTGVSVAGHAASITNTNTAAVVKSTKSASTKSASTKSAHSTKGKTKSAVPYTKPSATSIGATSRKSTTKHAIATASHSACHKSRHARDFNNWSAVSDAEIVDTMSKFFSRR